MKRPGWRRPPSASAQSRPRRRSPMSSRPRMCSMAAGWRGRACRRSRPPPAPLGGAERLPPVLSMAIAAAARKDDVKLGQALLRLNEEDPSLTMIQNPRTHDIVLWGQGEMHLRVALERLRDRFGVNVKSQPPSIGYLETIRKSITQRRRHK